MSTEPPTTIDCAIFRCGRQEEMYLYLRSDRKPEDLPEALLKLTGRLVHVMDLSLNAQRRLARVDVAQVIERLAQGGYFLQMPPDGHLKAHLHFGD